MSTPEFEVHRAIVHSSNVTTGAAEVRIPSLLGAGQTVSIPTTGLTLTAGEWNVPSAGSSAFVAVSADRTQFLWLTGVTVPTDSDIDFTDNVTIGGDLTVDGEIDATHINSEFDGPVVLSIKNTSASTIAKGTPVYATGSVGASGAVEVSPSFAQGISQTMPALGLTQKTLAVNEEGHAVVLGVIDQMDTSAYNINDSLYVSTTGGLTTTRPTGDNDLIQKIGRVVRVNQSTGEILVLGAGRTNDVPNFITANGLRIDSDTLYAANGNVGIGTTNPVMPIDFNAPGTSGARMRFEDGTSETSGIQFTANGSSVNYSTQPFLGKEGLNDSDPLGIWHSGAWRMVVNSSGNVGIGTTSPSKLLHVSAGTSGDAEVRIEADTDNNNEGDLPYLTFAADGGILEGVVGLNDNTMVFANSVTSSQGFDFRTGTTNYYTNGADVVANTTSRLFIDSSGNVGIGDNTPSYKLDVNGSGRFTANGSSILTLKDTGSTATGGYIRFESSDSNLLGYIGYGNNDDIHIYNNRSNGYIYFRSGGGWRAYFDATGQFLPYTSNTYDLGSTSRRWQDVYAYTINLNSQNGSRLQMYGETHSFGVQSATTYARSSSVHAWYRGGSHNNNSLNPGTGGQYQAHLDYYGSIWINDRAFKPNAGSWESSSDARIKKNVVDYSGGLSVITSLRPVYYEWDAEGHMFPEGQHLGLIAQEVEEVYPRFVNTFTQDVTRVSDGEVITDSKTLSYTGEFNALMISAIKELSEQVTALTARIEVLEGG